MSKYKLDLTKEFVGKRALITGGSRGIGAATAQRLLDGGATVVVTARNTHAETPKGATFISGDTRAVEGAQVVLHVRAIPKHAPLLGVNEPADDPQQAGLAGAVSTGHLEARARLEREIHPAQHVAFAAPEVQSFDSQRLIGHSRALGPCGRCKVNFNST